MPKSNTFLWILIGDDPNAVKRTFPEARRHRITPEYLGKLYHRPLDELTTMGAEEIARTGNRDRGQHFFRAGGILKRKLTPAQRRTTPHEIVRVASIDN